MISRCIIETENYNFLIFQLFCKQKTLIACCFVVKEKIRLILGVKASQLTSQVEASMWSGYAATRLRGELINIHRS